MGGGFGVGPHLGIGQAVEDEDEEPLSGVDGAEEEGESGGGGPKTGLGETKSPAGAQQAELRCARPGQGPVCAMGVQGVSKG